jgi:hypothetical protein
VRTRATSGQSQTAFVVWDFETHALRVPLESLVTHVDAELLFVVPGLGATDAGDLFRATVLPGIANADRVVAVVQRPNANVGFEIGLALGLGKPVLLLAWGKERPLWLNARPFAGSFVESIESARELRAKAASSLGLQLEPADAKPGAAFTLALCATTAEADACRQETSINAASWSEPPTTPFGFEDLEHRFASVDRVIWTVAAHADGSDDRDGAENTTLAAIAGWFLGRELRGSTLTLDAERWTDLQSQLVVLRSESARRVVDVTLFERTWKTLADYRAHLARLTGSAPAARSPSARVLAASAARAASIGRPVRFDAMRAAKVCAAVFAGLMLLTCLQAPSRPPLEVWVGAAMVALLAGASTTLVLRGYHAARSALRRSSSPPSQES